MPYFAINIGLLRSDSLVRCCKLVLRLLNNELSKQTQRFQHVLHVNSRGHSSTGRPIKCQGTPRRRGVPTGSLILQRSYSVLRCEANAYFIGSGRAGSLSFFFSGCRPRFSRLAASPLDALSRPWLTEEKRETARSLA